MSILRLFAIVVAISFAQQHAIAQHHHSSSSAGDVAIELVGANKYAAGNTAPAVVRLTLAGKPLGTDALEEVHTEKLHLLVIDETLTDYHHEHPAPTDTPGEYRFTFAPRLGGKYYVWADVTPKATGQQVYAKSQLTVDGPAGAGVDNKLTTVAEAGGFRFRLAPEKGQPLRRSEEHTSELQSRQYLVCR